MVWEAATTVKIPVIGIGGISAAEDNFDPDPDICGRLHWNRAAADLHSLECGWSELRLSPSSVMLDANPATATLSINTSSLTPTGTYKIAAKGASEILVHSTTFTLTVQGVIASCDQVMGNARYAAPVAARPSATGCHLPKLRAKALRGLLRLCKAYVMIRMYFASRTGGRIEGLVPQRNQ